MSKNFELLRELQVNLSPEPAPAYAIPGLGSVSESTLKQAKAPAVVRKRSASKSPIAALDESPLAREEALKLVHNVFLAPGENAPRIVVFAAIDSGNGCSRVTGLAARALAMHVSAPVCLVDANMRTPSGSGAFQVDTDYGLADSLRSPGPISQFVQCVSPENLSVLSCGSGARDSVGLLTSSNMRGRIGDLRNEFGYILIDAPPLNSYADAITVAQQADGLVLILEANATRRESALKVAEHLRAMQVKLLGAVLNKRTFPIPDSIYHRL